METDRNLRSTDVSGSTATAFAMNAMAQSAKGGPRWLRAWMTFLAVIIALVALIKLYDTFANFGKLPKCDAQRTKDTLSDLNKSNQVNASSYNFIKPISASDTEVICTASLALRDGGTLEYDYRIYKEGSGVKVQITNLRR